MRALRTALLPLGLALVLWAAWAVPLPAFVERPGSLLSLAEHVHVEVEPPAQVDGDFLLTVANLRRATMVGLVQGLLDPDAGFIRQERIIPPGVDDAAYFARQRDVFREAADVAAAVGLAAAGYPVDPTQVVGDGVVVLQVMDGLPAAGVLEPGDEIVAVDGAPVRTAEELSAAVGAGTDPLAISFRRGDEESSASLTPQLRAVGGQQRPIIGVEIQTLNPRIELPVPVNVESGRIGGPSAGLLIALTVFDKASEQVDLAAGRRIAGTGGLDAAGTVEGVGGIPHKVVAAHRAEADIFLVPAQQHETALAALPPDSPMQVVPAATFDDAVAALGGEAGHAASEGSASRGRATLALPVVVIAGRASVRSRATLHREPGQGRKAAAISGSQRAPRGSRAGPSARR